MQFTLRKASKLISKIDTKIGELNQEKDVNIQKDFLVYDSKDVVLAELNSAREKVIGNIGNILLLQAVRTNIRTAIGQANAAIGINTLLSAANGLQQRIGVLRYTVRVLQADVRPDDAVIINRLETQAVLSKTSDRASIKDNIYLKTLTEKDREDLKAQLKIEQDNLDIVHDQLESLNVTTQVDLADADINVLKNAGIL